jgi:glycogen synthase
MKILMLSNIFPPGFIGGYELGALDVALGLKKLGHEIHVLTSDYFLDELDEIGELNVSRSLFCSSISHEVISSETIVKQGLFYNFHNIRAIGSAIRRFCPDMVLLFNISGLGAISIIQYLDKIRIPSVLYLMDNVFQGLDRQSNIYKKYTQSIGKTAIGSLMKVIAMSKNIENEVIETLGHDLGSVTFIPGWVDFDIIQEPQIIIKEKEPVKFVFCSRVAPHKGVDIMLDAADELVKNGFKDFSIDIYGSGQVAVFMQKVKTKNLDSYIKYKGITSKAEMLLILSKYDALLFPTWEREAFGFVASEAAASGCFPIMTNGIGVSEWFFDNYDCLKIDRNVNSLYAAMLQTMLFSKEEFFCIRSTALRSARNNFPFKKWLSIIENICFEMVKKREFKNTNKLSKGVESGLLVLNSLSDDTL